jgi:hypothetical protein
MMNADGNSLEAPYILDASLPAWFLMDLNMKAHANSFCSLYEEEVPAVEEEEEMPTQKPRNILFLFTQLQQCLHAWDGEDAERFAGDEDKRHSVLLIQIMGLAAYIGLYDVPKIPTADVCFVPGLRCLTNPMLAFMSLLPLSLLPLLLLPLLPLLLLPLVV